VVFSEDRGSWVPAWKNPHRTHRCEWGLLKVREREIDRECGGHRWSLLAEKEHAFSGAFKTYTNPCGGQAQEIPTQ
jgi:hypothetical protein